MEVKPKKQRITSIDILRGMTIAGMILVNNPGGPEEETYAPLQHAEWLGLTPTDLIFPFFILLFFLQLLYFLSCLIHHELQLLSVFRMPGSQKCLYLTVRLFCLSFQLRYFFPQPVFNQSIAHSPKEFLHDILTLCGIRKEQPSEIPLRKKDNLPELFHAYTD